MLLGVSGRDMIEALIGGERDPAVLADLAQGRLRARIDGLQMACAGRFSLNHAQMCRLHQALDTAHTALTWAGADSAS